MQQNGADEKGILHGQGENLPIYQSLNLPHKATGALYVAWSSEEAQALEVLAEEAGEKCTRLDSEDGVQLAKQVTEGFRPGETTLDPGLVPLAFAADAHRCGAHVWEQAQASIDEVPGAWRLRLPGLLQSPILTQHLVNCTGLEPAPKASSNGERSLSFKPRRGDYLLFRRPDAAATPPLSRPIGAVPTPLARGVYVWPTVHGDVLCGPTNVAQEHSELPVPSAATLEALRDKAVSVCPALAEWPVAGAYAGLRPALDPTAFGSDYFLTLGWAVGMGEHRFSSDALFASEESYAKTKGFIELAQRQWQVAHPQTCLGLATTAGVCPMPGPSQRSGSAVWFTGTAPWTGSLLKKQKTKILMHQVIEKQKLERILKDIMTLEAERKQEAADIDPEAVKAKAQDTIKAVDISMSKNMTTALAYMMPMVMHALQGQLSQGWISRGVAIGAGFACALLLAQVLGPKVPLETGAKGKTEGAHFLQDWKFEEVNVNSGDKVFDVLFNQTLYDCIEPVKHIAEQRGRCYDNIFARQEECHALRKEEPPASCKRTVQCLQGKEDEKPINPCEWLCTGGNSNQAWVKERCEKAAHDAMLWSGTLG
eukprot:s80_g32.t3